MTSLTKASARWIPALLAVALIVLAVIRSSPTSWLFGGLGLALLIKSGAEALDREGEHKRAVALLYVSITALGLVIYLVSSR